MAYETKPGDISIFQNKNKKTETHPLLTGKAVLNVNELAQHVDGNGNVTLYVALWAKQGDGGTFWAGNIKLPRPRTNESNDLPPTQQDTQSPQPDPRNAEDITGANDDLPF